MCEKDQPECSVSMYVCLFCVFVCTRVRAIAWLLGTYKCVCVYMYGEKERKEKRKKEKQQK